MRKWCIYLLCLSTVSLSATFIDNRYFVPYLLHEPYFFLPENKSHLRFATFAGSAFEGYGELGNDIPLFDITQDLGTHVYDQREIARALQKTGSIQERLIPSEFEADPVSSLQWNMQGHIEMQGVDLSAHYPLTSWCSVGASWYFMLIASRLELEQATNPFAARPLQDQGREERLFMIKDRSHDALGLQGPIFYTVEPGDLDLSARFSWNAEYAYKFQYIDLGLQAGLLLPTSQQQDIHNPASVPTGGNNHTGIYFSFQPHMILKDNIRAGCDLRVIKRFAKQMMHRMPIGQEPIRFGAAVAPAEVDPGVTAGFSPYLILQEIREGFGFMARYSLVGHTQDSWRNIQVPPRLIVDRDTLRRSSSWAIEHFAGEAFYDFGYDRHAHESTLRFRVRVEAPIEWFASQRAAKMYGVSATLEGSF